MHPYTSQQQRIDTRPLTAATFEILSGQLIKVAMIVEANCSLVSWLRSLPSSTLPHL